MNMRALALYALLAACSPAAPGGAPPLAGSTIGGPFSLTDQNGRTVTDRDFAGKYRVVYFGYTFCPDVCPVDVQNIGRAMMLLEKDRPELAARIAPLFITVDPARDTPAVLKQFVAAFHPRLIGLTGSAEAIARVARAYGVYYRAGDPSAAGGYMVDHGRQAYLMGPDGKPLALLPQDESSEAIVREIERWAA